MDTPFYHDSMSGAFTPHHHHALPHRFHGDYERYLSNSGSAGKAAVAAAAPKKAIPASSYFSDPVAAAGLGTAAAAGGAKPNSFQGLPLPPAPSAASNVGQSLASPASSSSATSDADLLLVQATNHHGLAMTGHTPMLPAGGGSGHTPNSNHPGGHLLYRATQQATNEQEGFVDGFVKALADLHKQNQLSGVSGSGGGAPGTGGGGSGVAGTGPGGAGGGADAPIYTNLSSYGAQNHMGYHQVGYQGSAGGLGGREAAGSLQVVPHAPPLPTLPLHNSSSSPTLSPVDLETQERIKSERKKLRNRIAASKCRKRKLERIARLEDKVSLLKSFNGDLASTAAILKQEVEHLREKVRIHMTRGCQIIITGGGGGRRGGEAMEKEENPSWGKKPKY